MTTVNHVGHGSTPSRCFRTVSTMRNHQHTEHNLERPVGKATDRQRSDQGASERWRQHWNRLQSPSTPRRRKATVADAVEVRIRDDSTRLHCYREHLRAPVAEPSCIDPPPATVLMMPAITPPPANKHFPPRHKSSPYGARTLKRCFVVFIAPHRCR